MTLALGVEKGTLLDLETSGLPQDREHEIVNVGYITSNKLVIFCRRCRSKTPYYSEIRRLIQHLPEPFYAFNAPFDEAIIREELGLVFPRSSFINLMKPWRIKAELTGLKWPSLSDLISEPEKYFAEPMIRGKDVPGLWKRYLSTGSEKMLELIMQHSLSDLLREATLLLLHPELYEKSKS